MLRRSSWVAVEREALWMLLFNPKFCHTKPNFLNSFLNNYPILHTSLPSLSILFQPNYTAAIRNCSSQSNSHSSSIPKTTRKQSKHMADTPQPHQNPHQQQQPPNVTSTVNPNVNRMQQLLQGSSSGGWERCWDEGLTPWDLGQPTPVVVHLHRTGALPKGRVLVPGCGSGYDVVAIACPERYVVGLEISDKAIKRAIGLASASPNADYCTFLKADFFSWQPTELFDVIFDYTFFCAIEPDMRSAWASRIQDLLKPDGELITLMFPISDHVGGPPYKASVADYEDVLHPVGFEAVSIVENELAIGPRKGREKVGRWKKLIGQSSL